MSNKRKRIIEDTEEDEQPDSKKQKIEDEREALKSLRTYDISEIKEIIKKNNKLESLDIVEIESGFTLIRPDYLIIKLDENKKFVVTKRQ
jgi:RecA/RadA recombinase